MEGCEPLALLQQIQCSYIDIIKQQKMKRGVDQILSEIQEDKLVNQKLESMTKNHYDDALQFYDEFQDNITKTLQNDMKQMKNALNVQLARSIRKLEFKLKGGYLHSLSDTIKTFNLEGFVEKQIQNVYKAFSLLKLRVYEYIHEFSSQILSQNIEYSEKASLFHFTNTLKSLDDTWKSVTSRCPLKKAIVTVRGFSRPQTSWLALGVSKKMKEYGPLKTSLGSEDFMGNIYLNGTNDLKGGYRLKRDLSNNDSFEIVCENRMVTVNRVGEIKKKNEIFIMDDNVNYLVYLAIRGPIQLDFVGQ